MAKAKVALPTEWRLFANRYGADRAYWYVPKGLAVSSRSLKSRLAVLKEFEAGKPWRECQAEYVQRLNDEDISDAAAGDDGGAPLARMLKQVFVMLGLAWVDPKDRVEITPAGERLLSDKDPGSVLSEQLSRFQFTNPSVGSKVHSSIALHPVPFIGEVLRSLDGQSVSGVEYNLFIARAKRQQDVDSVVETIENFRATPVEVRNLVVQACEAYKLPGVRRSSVYNTIRLDRSYAFRMFSLSRLLEITDEGGLRIRRGALKDYRPYLAEFGREGTYIDFANEKDWVAFFGDPSAKPTIETALEYYVSKGNVLAAVAAKKRVSSSPKEISAFRDMIISEKAVEDYLENHLDVIGSKISSSLRLVGRQYGTTVGPIDLLTVDTRTGDYVVIELKKGRSADKVYGQCSRYMGWVRKNLAERGAKVHGAIVARQIDDKLKAARDAHDTQVHLIEFEMRIGAKAV